MEVWAARGVADNHGLSRDNRLALWGDPYEELFAKASICDKAYYPDEVERVASGFQQFYHLRLEAFAEASDNYDECIDAADEIIVFFKTLIDQGRGFVCGEGIKAPAIAENFIASRGAFGR